MQSAPPEKSSPVNPGDVLAGKYRVERVLGAGGMGVVVQALHLELQERVALKFLLPEAVESAEMAARFVREARAAVKIKSEHVARVIDVGRLENGAPFMVMEFLEGHDLNAALERGPLAIEDAVDYLIQACDAMAEAHAGGIVHRDLKPSNLFLTRRADGSGLVKVLDFGISKVNASDIAEANLTRASTMMGSPYYISPEQMRSARDADHRSDVWSLGVILYELLAGSPPFLSDNLPGLLTAIISDPPIPIRSKRADVTPELESVILRALVKDRTQRFQSVGELAAALIPFAPRRSRYMAERIFKMSGMGEQVIPSSFSPAKVGGTVRLEAGSTAVPAASAVGASTNANFGQTKPAGSTGKAIALGAGLGIGFLVVAVVALLMARRPAESASASSATAPPPVVTAAAAPVEKPAPAEVPSTPVAVAPVPVKSAEAPAASATIVPNQKPASPVAKRAEGKTSATSAAPPATQAPAPSPAPAVKKNPLAIDLK